MLKKTYTVSEISYAIKNVLEGESFFKGFMLKGEISNFVRHRTGHLYFNLKDENSQIRAIMFQGYTRSLNFNPKDGDKVTVTGSLSVYVPGGTYSMNVVKMEAEGEGELYLKYLELKNKLKSIGWFDKPKKALPKYPKRIGVVTSPTGAVIQDITNTVNRRYRLTEILLYPALVQGPSSSKSITQQINKANEDNLVDILIVGRGGGSIEDLWGYNELETITAIYNSKIPIITAIGHETDDTLSDLVSDLRAPTPTAAAELATPNTEDLIDNLRDIFVRNRNNYISLINSHQNNLVHLTERLEISGPKKKLENNKSNLNNLEVLLNNYYKTIIVNNKNKLNEKSIKLNNLTPHKKLEENIVKLNNIKVNLDLFYKYKIEREVNKLQTTINSLNNNAKNTFKDKVSSFTNITNILEKVNPLKIMDRGFALISDDNNNVVDSIKKVNVGDNINLDFKDGRAVVNILEKKENN